MAEFQENVIEWLTGDARNRATLTLSQKRLVNRIKKIAQERPDECEIVAVNQDGSIVAHCPIKWIKINPTLKLSEEARRERSARMTQRYAKHAEDNQHDLG